MPSASKKPEFPDTDDADVRKLSQLVDVANAQTLGRPVPVGKPPAAEPATPLAPSTPTESRAAPAPPASGPRLALSMPTRTADRPIQPAPVPAPTPAKVPDLTLKHLPADLRNEIKKRALEGNVTERVLVLQALKDAGFNVPDSELIDRRKFNGPRRLA